MQKSAKAALYVIKPALGRCNRPFSGTDKDRKSADPKVDFSRRDASSEHNGLFPNMSL